MKSNFLKSLWKILLFLPILLYFGKRSYLAYDEGFYALQARWMIENNNWLIPTWWEYPVLDRTIGIQFLIAKSQQIFGETSFNAHLPSTIASGLILIITIKLHQELLEKKDSIYSALILATTYLWFNFAHLATQDMIFAFLVNLGIYALVKVNFNQNNNSLNNLYLIIFGGWIGLAFMMKTFLTAVPLIALAPYLYQKIDIMKKKAFWAGLLLGFIPFILWVFLVNQVIEKNILLYLFDKFNNLSNKNTFTNPIYYYLWNIPLNFMPWSIYSIFGFILNFKNKKIHNYFLFYFPLFFIILISLFSSKTPYYALPLTPIFSINAYIGIKELLKNKNTNQLFYKFLSKVIPIILFLIVIVYLNNFRNIIKFNLKEEGYLISGICIFGIIYYLIPNIKKSRYIFLSIILGPYLLTTSIIQSGLLTDRSKSIRESMEYIVSNEKLDNKLVRVNINSIKDDQANSKIIRISLLTPNLGESIERLDELGPTEYGWTIFSKDLKFDDKKYELIYSDEHLKPWKLVKKKI